MSRGAIRGLTFTGFAPVKAAVRGLVLTGSQTGKAAVRGMKITGAVAPPKAAVRGVKITGDVGVARAAVRGLSLIGGGPLSAQAGGGRFAEPFATVTLDGRLSVGATTWSWAQVGNTVTLTPVSTPATPGAVVTFQAPATENGADLVFRLTVGDGTTTDTDDASISVYPHLFWRRNLANTAWVPERIFDGL